MEKPETPAPMGSDADRDALARLDVGLAALEARGRKAPAALGGMTGSGAGEGYRLLSQMLGGVLGGVGLGWLFDSVAHSRPWGLLIGLFAGVALSVWSMVRMATQAGKPAKAKAAKPKVMGQR
jgi:ATP synthase protein I